MGNGIGSLNLCFAGDAGEISRRRHDIAVYLSDPLDEGLGHSFCYLPDPSLLSKSHPDDATAPFRTISGASISANTYTPLSTSLIDPFLYNSSVIDKASSFQSSDSFASIPLQPIPRNSIPSVRSGPIPQTSGAGWGSGPIERGFLSGPIERSFISGPMENQYEQLQRYKPKSKTWCSMKVLKKAISKSMALPKRKGSRWANGSEKNNENGRVSSVSNNLSCQLSLADDDGGDEAFESHNVQWAQGKAGEDRVHVVISEEHGWVFVGIYDGFNGPDATDYLLNSLYSNVYSELKGLLWNDNSESTTKLASVQNDEFDQSRIAQENCSCEDGDLNFDCDLEGKRCENSKKRSRGEGKKWEESQRRWKCQWDRERVEIDSKLDLDVLKALSEALRKTEEAYLEIADMMVMENPELALMGSCVLAMLMKGDDVYLMNVGDSRAVLAQKSERINVKTMNGLEAFDGVEVDSFPSLVSCQLTTDHSTSMGEEVRRILREHPDDASAVRNDRVKGSLKVTRAFGAGFLKQPNWNNALLEMFRIDYVGTSPYVTCIPSLYHHRLGPRDRFLILSSDGLYQYFTNEEAVSEVETFIASFPEGDPAQHLVEEVLFRAAKKAGMDFYELLDIPQGDRRRYHDDVSIIIISFEGRIWRSSV